MLFEEFEIFQPAIKPEHVTRPFEDQVDQYAAIDEVIVNDKVVGVFNERPVHMREPVDNH